MSSFPEKLADRYRRFHHRHFLPKAEEYEELATHGQNPDAMVISCSDSRVDPETIFSAMPGEMFVVRNVANLVPPYEPHRDSQHGTSAALEFGVQALRVKHIVVLGHAFCGGIRAFADEQEPLSPGDFIGRWMSLMAPALAKVGPRGSISHEDYIESLEKASVVNTLDNLLTFPRLRKLIERGEVTLHGAYFGVALGELSVLDKATGEFRRIVARTGP
jgi:carbonic anhydrase